MEKQQELIELAGLFIENEKLLRDLYGLCVEKIPVYKDSWEALQKMEDEHARIFEEIKTSIEQFPTHWTKGKIFPQALRVSIENLKARTHEFKAGTANRKYILNFLMDCEQSLIEAEMTRAFQTDRDDLLVKVNRMQEETIGHKNLLRTIISKEK